MPPTRAVARTSRDSPGRVRARLSPATQTQFLAQFSRKNPDREIILGADGGQCRVGCRGPDILALLDALPLNVVARIDTWGLDENATLRKWAWRLFFGGDLVMLHFDLVGTSGVAT